MDNIPKVEAQARWIKHGSFWELKINCPYCGKEHIHGGGNGKRPFYGHRLSHCVNKDTPGYELIPAEPKLVRLSEI